MVVMIEIPGVAVLSEGRRKKLLDETLRKSQILVDHLVMLMIEAMSSDPTVNNKAFMKLGNIVNSLVVKDDKPGQGTSGGDS